MKKYVDWILAHKVKTGLIVLSLFLLPLLVIHFLYKWQTPYFLIQSSWSSGELITYIAGFEAFLGTVFLGIVAVRQNDKANELNERMMKIEEDSCLFTRYPNLLITCSKTEKESFSGIFNKDDAIYSCLENFDEFVGKKEGGQQNFYLFPFLIQNLSNFNIRYKVSALKLNNLFNASVCFDYKDTPINIHPKIQVLAPNSNFRIGILVDATVIQRDDLHRGVMNISVYNYISEEFFYTVEFELFIDINGDYAFYIVNVYDAKLMTKTS